MVNLTSVEMPVYKNAVIKEFTAFGGCAVICERKVLVEEIRKFVYACVCNGLTVEQVEKMCSNMFVSSFEELFPDGVGKLFPHFPGQEMGNKEMDESHLIGILRSMSTDKNVSVDKKVEEFMRLAGERSKGWSVRVIRKARVAAGADVALLRQNPNSRFWFVLTFHGEYFDAVKAFCEPAIGNVISCVEYVERLPYLHENEIEDVMSSEFAAGKMPWLEKISSDTSGVKRARRGCVRFSR